MVQQSGFSEEVGVAVSELEDAVDNSEAGDHLDEDTEDKDHRPVASASAYHIAVLIRLVGLSK